MGSRESFNFFADNADASFVRSVQFEDTGAVEGGTEKGFCEGEDGGCFSGTWRTIEEHMGKLLRLVTVQRVSQQESAYIRSL